MVTMRRGVPPDYFLLFSLLSFASSPSHQRSLQIGAHGQGLGHGLRQRLGNEQRAGVQLLRGQRRGRGCEQVNSDLTPNEIVFFPVGAVT